MTTLRGFFLAAVLIQTCFPANLAVSTYFKDAFRPTAIASDAQGNLFVAGSAVIDPVAQTTGVAVAKLDPKASQYLYLAYLDSAANDQVSALAIDGAGNAYIAGSTTNPNFPAVGGGSLGTPPTGTTSNGVLDQRSFVTKLSPDGAVLLSVLIGGSVASQALGIAITPQGQILVSGLAAASGFPSTPGAYKIADSNGHWFLMELDAAASHVIFSATGIGGSSIAFDAAGNIYLAGSSVGADYPTTPGAYQTTFVQGHVCYGLCQIGFPGGLQHITKVDAAASKLIYSTGLNDTAGAAGSTGNTGLAVDAAGDAFVTGALLEAAYPFTVPAPSINSGYLSKLDPTGSSLLFSVPVGGGGVIFDASAGSVYVGGIVSSDTNPIGLGAPTTPVAPPAIFSWVPQPCWPDSIVAFSEAYVAKVDPATGNVLDAQWIDGSGPTAVGITLAGGRVWIAGATPAPDVPFTPGALSPNNFGTGFTSGAYLAAVDFLAGTSGGPAIACVLDAGNLEHVRAVTARQAISVFGANLGPSTGVVATFDGNPAQVLYASSSQINVVVPVLLPSQRALGPVSTIMQITVNGQTIQRQFPLALYNLNLFANLASNQGPCPGSGSTGNGFQPLAVNADGSVNSCANPAKFGSSVSFFLHGVGADVLPPPAPLQGVQAFIGTCPAAVNNASPINGFVYKVDVLLPTSLSPCGISIDNHATENSFSVTLSYNDAPVGPLVVPPPPQGPIVNFTPGSPTRMIVWVAQ